jgi:hypothetical protein
MFCGSSTSERKQCSLNRNEAFPTSCQPPDTRRQGELASSDKHPAVSQTRSSKPASYWNGNETASVTASAMKEEKTVGHKGGRNSARAELLTA